MINSTRLLRRAERYLEKFPGQGRQGGHSKLSICAGCNDPNAVRRLKQGKYVNDTELGKLDTYLTEQGF